MTSAWQARAWWEHGELAQLYPGGVPVAVVKAINAIEAGYYSGQADRPKD